VGVFSVIDGICKQKVAKFAKIFGRKDPETFFCVRLLEGSDSPEDLPNSGLYRKKKPKEQCCSFGSDCRQTVYLVSVHREVISMLSRPEGLHIHQPKLKTTYIAWRDGPSELL